MQTTDNGFFVTLDLFFVQSLSIWCLVSSCLSKVLWGDYDDDDDDDEDDGGDEENNEDDYHHAGDNNDVCSPRG